MHRSSLIAASRPCIVVAVWTLWLAASMTSADAQFVPAAAPSPVAPPPAALPEPIYWKQNLFLIPYQWSSSADPSAAQSVWLLVSSDRGASWQKISEAKPQVKAFNYHAGGEGEYWFAIRTIDRAGQPQPPGPYLPELRVIVDTTMPRLENFAAQVRSDGALQIQWRATDSNIDPTSWKFEVQLDASDTWQPVPLAGLAISPLTAPTAQTSASTSEGQTVWQLPPGARPRAIRATVYDRAGNSASYGAVVAAAPGDIATAARTGSIPLAAPQGWISSSDAPSVIGQLPNSSTTQPWPTGVVAHTPFRLADGAGPAPGDQVTSYGNPLVQNSAAAAVAGAATPGAEHRTVFAASQASDQPQRAPMAPLEPFREPAAPFRHASLTRLPAVGESTNAAAPATSSPQEPSGGLPHGVAPMHVGSRTFALEYELEDFGRGGISKIELWGTRDGGKTWRSYAVDDDQRSPLVVTVDDVGVYGFRIVVESAGGTPAIPPRSGDAPELWVEVDLNQPTAEITAIQSGAGNQAGHLIVNWRADDDNLDPRPIGLFYSSRPAGPWTAIATNLNNSGQYAWQLQRHLPDRVYLRLEARDTAGNLAAFQTRDPIQLAPPTPSARLQSAEPVAPTATSAGGAFR